VIEAKDILLRGKEVREQINILGDDGVPIEFHERFWKSELIDFVILQQDAFDKIDASTPLSRQQYMLDKVLDVAEASFILETSKKCLTFLSSLSTSLSK
jgi:V/A-type H+/Na+-transporting ATPase subunit A